MFNGSASFQPGEGRPMRVTWFDQYAATQVAPRSATIASDAGATIETVTVEASRLPSWLLIGGAVLGALALWRAFR